MSSEIRRAVNRGLAWVGLAGAAVSILDIVANVVILAFWISPAEYGVAALAITLFPALDLVADAGIAQAIVQSDDVDEDRLSTAFWFNLTLSLLLAVIVALVIGPVVAGVHGQPVVRLLLAAYGIKLIWQNVYWVPRAMMFRELRFREVSIVRISANAADSAAKVAGAAAGLGIWCFVLGPMVRELGWGLGIQLARPWRPRLVLHLRRTLAWLRFGLKTSASQLLFQLYTNADYQVVGYVFGPAANGAYKLAYDIVLEPCRILAQLVVQVAFPAYARLKNQPAQLYAQFIAFTRLNLVLLLSLLGIVLLAAEPLLASFWGPEWTSAADAARVLCVVGALRALGFLVPPLLEAVGRPGLRMTYNAVAALILPTCFVAGAVWLGDEVGYLSVALAWAVGYPIAFALLAWMALATLDVRAVDYARRVGGIVACALPALGLGAAAHWIFQDLPAGAVLGATAAVYLVSFFVALAYFQGITARSVVRALKS